MIKDAAARYKVIGVLKEATKEINLPNIKVVASARPKSKGPGFKQDDGQVSEMLDLEAAEAARAQALTEEEHNEGVARTSTDGVELCHVMANFEKLADAMQGGVPSIQKGRIGRWRTAMSKAMKAFNRGAAIALADIWHEDKRSPREVAVRNNTKSQFEQ